MFYWRTFIKLGSLCQTEVYDNLVACCFLNVFDSDTWSIKQSSWLKNSRVQKFLVTIYNISQGQLVWTVSTDEKQALN